MQLANPLHRRAPYSRKSQPSRPAPCAQAIAEIHAYIAIRDELLAEAEKLRTPAKLDSLSIANDYLATCLRPARAPYEAQCLAETDAERARARCEVVRGRIAHLRLMVRPGSQFRDGRM